MSRTQINFVKKKLNFDSWFPFPFYFLFLSFLGKCIERSVLHREESTQILCGSDFMGWDVVPLILWHMSRCFFFNLFSLCLFIVALLRKPFMEQSPRGTQPIVMTPPQQIDFVMLTFPIKEMAGKVIHIKIIYQTQ